MIFITNTSIVLDVKMPVFYTIRLNNCHKANVDVISVYKSSCCLYYVYIMYAQVTSINSDYSFSAKSTSNVGIFKVMNDVFK